MIALAAPQARGAPRDEGQHRVTSTLAILAPLVISGCALFAPVVGPAAILSPPPGGIEHDGYRLFCGDVELAVCRAEAERVAAESGRGRAVRWIVIRTDGHEVCFETGAVGICESNVRPAATG